TSCSLALISTASYPVLVHRLAVSLDASSPRPVALPQLRFASLAVVSSREDLHLQECARAGRTKSGAPKGAAMKSCRPRCGDRRFLLPYGVAGAIWMLS